MSNQLPARRSEDSANGKSSSLEPLRSNRVITVGESKGQESQKNPAITYHVSGDLHLHNGAANVPAVAKPESKNEIELRERLERQRLRDLHYLDPYPYYSPYRWYYNHPDHWYGGGSWWRGAMLLGGGLLFLVVIFIGFITLLAVIAMGLKPSAPVTTNIVVSEQASEHPMTFDEYLRTQAR